MSQPTDNDFSIDAGLGAIAWRERIDDYVEGLLTKLSGATAPSTTFPFMWWVDTSVSPVELKIRNGADSAWIKVAEIDTSDVKLFSELAATVGLANTASFTQPQTIDVTGAAGSMAIKSDRTTGIVASVDGGGHDDGGNDTIYASWDFEAVDDTDGSEDGQAVCRIIEDGSEVARLTVGATVIVNGTLNATTLQQGGTGVSSLIEAAKGAITTDGETGTSVTVPDDLTRGERNKFTGSSASNYTIDSGTAGNIYPLMNDGTADITFVEGSGVTIIGGLTLGQQSVCTIEYVTATRVFIYGQNV